MCGPYNMSSYRFRGMDPRVKRALLLSWGVFLLNTGTFVTSALVIDALASMPNTHRTAELVLFALAGSLFVLQFAALQCYVHVTRRVCKRTDLQNRPPGLLHYLWPLPNAIGHALVLVGIVATAAAKQHTQALNTPVFALFLAETGVNCVCFVCGAIRGNTDLQFV